MSKAVGYVLAFFAAPAQTGIVALTIPAIMIISALCGLELRTIILLGIFGGLLAAWAILAIVHKGFPKLSCCSKELCSCENPKHVS